MIDLRSDTVTRPSKGMLASMMSAEVGDDGFGDDPSVNRLQAAAASLFGREAALFCPTGTMANQIAIRLHTRPGDEVICHELSHVYLNEGGGIAVHSGASVRLLRGLRGLFTADEVRRNVNARDNPQYPATRLVVVENTVTRAGGACWSPTEIQLIREACDQNDLALHLDGARLFNALVANSQPPAEFGRMFHTLAICLSKGLGAPAGSLIVGSKTHIAAALRLRKLMGGTMRQSGYLAAAGLYALENHVERLSIDHEHARAVEHTLQTLSYVSVTLPAETNIIIFSVSDRVDPIRFLDHLNRHDITPLQLALRTFRLVFHLDVSRTDVDRVLHALRTFD